MMHTCLKKIFLLYLLSGSLAAYAAPWNGSTSAPGLSGTTYTVSTAEQLAWVAEQSQTTDFAGYTILLEADLDLGGVEANPPRWSPIGCAAFPFQGELDGNNHVIYNMYILNSFSGGAGLIAQTGTAASVHNLGIAQGQILTDATNNVGCLAGINRGHIHHCFNMTQIIANNGDNIGGLVGTNEGTIEFSYNTGIITAANDFVGGLVGYNKTSAILNECFNSGYCKGNAHVGALFGKNEAPENNLTRVYFDQQVTRTYATGFGTEDVLDNTRYAVAQTSVFTAATNPFNGLPEWNVIRDQYYRYPRLQCFGEHEAALVSTNSILLDALNLPVERAEGVGAPKEGNKPRKNFQLIGISASLWKSPSENVISIVSSSMAEVVRPCGNQEVILTVTEGVSTKQIYTIVKGYEQFDPGKMDGSAAVCWNEADQTLAAANSNGKDPLGGKDDEQEGEYSYRYMIIRDTVTYNSHHQPVSFTPLDTFYMGQKGYEAWVMPTDVSGEYAFRRYVHDAQCTKDWEVSPGQSTTPGRVFLSVLLPFDPGQLYEKPDTVYGVPQTLTVLSERDASGGSGVFTYVWAMEQTIVDYVTGEEKKGESKNPVYVNGELVTTPTCSYDFTAAGEYVFTRRVSEKMCNQTPLESLIPHRVVVYEAINPGAIQPFERELCSPNCTDTIIETEPVTGGNGRYTYRWLCNGEPVADSDSTTLLLENIPMEHGKTYVFVRQVKDDTGLMDWQTSLGEVKITIYSDYDAGAIKAADDRQCLETGTIQEIAMAVSSLQAASGEGDFQYCWLLYKGGADTVLLDTIKQNSPALEYTITLGNYGLSVPVTIFVKRAVQNSRCLTEWKYSDNAAVWRLGRAEQHMTDVTVCKNDMPYTGVYTYTDGHEQKYTFTEAGETVVMHDVTIEGCPKEVTLLCRTTTPPVVTIQPIVSVCQSAEAIKIVYEVQEGLPDRFDILFSEQAKANGFRDSVNALLPASDTIAIALPENMPLGAYELTIVFYTATTGSSDCKGTPQTIPFSLDMDGYVHRKWNDVVFVDNSDKNCEPDCEDDKQFVAWQWYKNGELIPGATGQSYYEQGGLNGFYRVQMTTADGTVYYSCLYEMRPTEAIEDINADCEPVGEVRTFTIDGRCCRAPEQPGIYIQQWLDEKNQLRSRKWIVR